MSQFDDLLEKYAADLVEKCGVELDEELLRKVTLGLGPSIYNKDSSMVAASSESELETIKTNFLMKKLGLSDSDELMAGINEAVDLYGRSNPQKHRAVVYYLLVKTFGKEALYS